MNYSLELIRFIAVILITFTHTRNEFSEGLPFFFFEELPTIGTVTLSIVSGYLYREISFHKKSIIRSKVKSLLIPYLIANLIVIGLVLAIYYVTEVNYLNRLGFDFQLITEGVLSLNSPPINPPTYFIRDIFIIFVLAELVRNRNFLMLLILIPLMVFGKLLLRYDILALFVLGIFISQFSPWITAHKRLLMITLLVITCGLILAKYQVKIYKYPLAALLFLFLFQLKIKFFEVGAYSYLLHLYHSPVMVTVYPFLVKMNLDSVTEVLLQIGIALAGCYLLFLLTRKIPKLRILCGGR